MQKVGVFLPRVTVGFRSYARTLVALRVVLISLSSNPVFSKIRSALFPFLCSQSRSPVLLAWRHGTAWDFVFHILSLYCSVTSLLPHLFCSLIQVMSGFGLFPRTMQVCGLKKEGKKSNQPTTPSLHSPK